MNQELNENQVIQRLVRWAERHELVRAMILTSTRANPDARLDVFSDYDVILVVKDIRPFHEDDSWLEDFGKVLVVYRDPIQVEHGYEEFARITQYEDGTKIDYTISPVEWLVRVIEEPDLPDYLDIGYRVLHDKDQLTQRLKPATYRAYVPEPPGEAAYRTVVEEFFHEATYVAKNLWRDELLPAKYSLDHVMKFRLLRKMLEWRMEIDHNWSVKTGAYGKGLKRRLPPKLWSQFESTYLGAGLEENWEALFRTIDIFRKVAIEVGGHLGFAYLHDLDRRVIEYLSKVQKLDRGAENF